MELDIDNIKKYIISQQTYQKFNINYTPKEKDCIKNFKLKNFG